jgi:hypothetical protein
VQEPHDLRAFFRAVGHFSGQRALTSTPPERPDPTEPAVLLEEDNVRVGGRPLEVSAFLDGIQASVVVTYRAHRPVFMSYAAAGAVTDKARLVSHSEKLSVVCSRLDKDWVDQLGQGIPVEALSSDLPHEVEVAAGLNLSNDRDALEAQVLSELVAQGSSMVCVDGSLRKRPSLDNLVGVVKTTRSKFLEDESCLYRLPEGWRSPMFELPKRYTNRGTDGPRLFSTYVRLQDASRRGWDFGLIRLEASTPDVLEPMAARVLLERQNASSGDPRFDRHIASMRACEDALRKRRPSIFSISH